ncbi:MAG: dihydroorotase [Chthoniobacterales bacterium]|nr:dihydroorotase [Chthoniobacterales bacterium]
MSACVNIRGGRVIDPATGRDDKGDVFIVDGKFSDVPAPGAQEIDAAGLVVCPGFIDIHVHLREPGQSAKETIETGTRAAAAGGFTSVVAMPNTQPVADHPGIIAWVQERAAAAGAVNVFPTGAITVGSKGEQLAPIGAMAAAGIVAVTDDGRCVQNHEVMRRAAEYCRMFDLPLFDHCQDTSVAGAEAAMHEGFWSTVLGLPGWPRMAEEIIVARDAMLAELTGARIHCQHLSAAGSVRIMREARARGVSLSGEVCPHHIALTDESLKDYSTDFKMNPPLREQTDIDALLGGLADGTIDILATDHAPHTVYEKEVEFAAAPFGIVGLETAVGLFCEILLHRTGAVDLPRMVAMLTVNPARLLGLDRGTLGAGRPGDVTILDPAREWVVDKELFATKGRNTPFHGWKLRGRALRTIVGGRTAWEISR